MSSSSFPSCSRDRFAADKEAWQQPQKDALTKLVTEATAAGRDCEWGKWAREEPVRLPFLPFPPTGLTSHSDPLQRLFLFSHTRPP